MKRSVEKKMKEKLKKYLDDLKTREMELLKQAMFLQKHRFSEEYRWVMRQADILGAEYVEINNKVLGIYF